MQSSDFTYELRDEYQAEAYVVVPVVRIVVVAVRRPAVLRIVVPRPATDHTFRTLDGCPFLSIPGLLNFKSVVALLPPFSGMPLHRRAR